MSRETSSVMDGSGDDDPHTSESSLPLSELSPLGADAIAISVLPFCLHTHVSGEQLGMPGTLLLVLICLCLCPCADLLRCGRRAVS